MGVDRMVAKKSTKLKMKVAVENTTIEATACGFDCTKQKLGFYLAAVGALAGLIGTSFPEVSRYASGVAFCCTGFSVWLAHNNAGSNIKC